MKRPKQWAKVFVSNGENEQSRHQRLFEKMLEKPKRRWFADFENEGLGVVYALGRY